MIFCKGMRRGPSSSSQLPFADPVPTTIRHDGVAARAVLGSWPGQFLSPSLLHMTLLSRTPLPSHAVALACCCCYSLCCRCCCFGCRRPWLTLLWSMRMRTGTTRTKMRTSMRTRPLRHCIGSWEDVGSPASAIFLFSSELTKALFLPLSFRCLPS